jgi:O-antigen ligase
MTKRTNFRISSQPATYVLAYFVIVLSGFADLPRLFSVGTISVLGIFSVGYFCSGLLLLPHLAQAASLFSKKMLPLFAFTLWAATSLLWTAAPIHGIQNIIVVSTMLIMIWVAEGTTSVDPSFALWLEKVVDHSVVVAAVLYGGALIAYGPGTSDVIGARSFGVFALFGVAHCLARWRYGSRAGLAGALLVTLLIGASQSRLALGIAVALFPLAQLPGVRFGRLIKMTTVMVAVGVASYGALIYFDSLRNRFLTGDLALKVGSWAINVSGRLSFWRVTLQSFGEAPIFGKGAGSAEGLIESVFLDIQHAHSDYLRILHDYGYLGMALWLLAVVTPLVSLWRSWRVADQISRSAARVYLTAMLSLAAFLLDMTADNAMVYTFVVAPLGLIVGSAFGLRNSIRSAQIHMASASRLARLEFENRAA